MENCRTPFYFSEKITDCFATGTVPIYWGSDEIAKVFDPGGILVLTEDFDVNAISEDLYRELLPSIENNLEIVKNLESSDDLLFRTYIE